MRVKTLAAAVAATALVALTGCGSDGAGEGGMESVTVSLTHPDDLYGLPWNVGVEQGLFEENGVQIEEFVPSEGGGTTLQNVISGRLPFGEVATAAIVSGYLEGAPVQVVGSGVQSVADVLWVAPKDSDLETLEDAEDKRWGFTSPGSVTEAQSYLVPDAIGYGYEAVERTSTGGTGAGIALLEAGDVDLAYASPRVAADQSETFKVLGASSDYVEQYQQTMIISSRNYAEENPEATKALLAGYAASIDWIHENPEDAAALWAETADMDVADAEQILQDVLAADYWSVGYNPDAIDAAADALVFTHDVKDFDWSELLTDEYLPDDHKGEIP